MKKTEVSGKNQPKLGYLAISIVALFLVTMFLPAVQATSEVVTSDYNYGTYLGINQTLYKDIGEQDPTWDYYVVKGVIAEYGGYQGDDSNSPLHAYYVVAVPKSYAEEPPGNHEPTSGWRSTVADVSYTFQGITFTMRIPAFNVEYGTWTDSFWRYYYWDVSSFYSGGTWGFIFHDYTEFSVGIRVPQGHVFDAYAGGAIAIYEYRLLSYHLVAEEEYYWLRCYYDPSSRAVYTPSNTPTAPVMPKMPVDIPHNPAVE